MKITKADIVKGDLVFYVPTEKYQRVMEHLSKKNMRAGGHHAASKEDSKIFGSFSLEQVNEALQDFEE